MGYDTSPRLQHIASTERGIHRPSELQTTARGSGTDLINIQKIELIRGHVHHVKSGLVSTS